MASLFAPRVRQLVLLTTFLSLCWLGMQVVHGCGHVLAALIVQAPIERVVLHPLIFWSAKLAYLLLRLAKRLFDSGRRQNQPPLSSVRRRDAGCW